MAVFCQLSDPQHYTPCPWDISTTPGALQYFHTFFHDQYARTIHLAVESAIAHGQSPSLVHSQAELCKKEFYQFLDELVANPHHFTRPTILTIDHERDVVSRRHGFFDPYIDVKLHENQTALPLLPQVCRQLDALHGPDQLSAVIKGVFAGNIFDMGVSATAKKMLSRNLDFFTTRQSISRPWLMDDYDALAHRLLNGPPHRKAIYFIDNAGSDFILGVIPMIRWLAQRGTHVVIAANQLPSLNDMTAHDVHTWLPKLIEVEPSLRPLPLEIVSTGSGDPLIDLSQISDPLNAAASDADLVILEGMGRAVESNLAATFHCDAIKLAMIKDPFIAQRHHGKVFDVVCRFQPAKK